MRFALIAVALLALASCKPAPPQVVDAGDYDSFWLWAGVKPQPVLDKARSVYVLEAQIDESPAGLNWVPQRATTPATKGPDIWMVVRAHSLRWTPDIHKRLLARLADWRSAGNQMIGVQIDFDARTRHLDEYAAFLKDLRAHLPRDMKLSVTGLLDWSANGDPDQLAAIGGVVDEVVLQVYQGRKTIPGYHNYLAQLHRMKQPFKIGLVQGGEWQAPKGLTSNPDFKGYVVFLVNDFSNKTPSP